MGAATDPGRFALTSARATAAKAVAGMWSTLTAWLPARRRYEGASVSRRTANWVTRSTSANAEIKTDLVTLRNRHRDLIRSNPWAERAVAAIVNNVIGAGIRCTWKSSRRQKRWAAWWESTACDANGRLDGYGLQQQLMRAIAESGEVLVRRQWRLPADNLLLANDPPPLELRVLEADYLDHAKNEDLPGGGYIKLGVEFDAQDRRVGYWLFPRHPGEGSGVATSVFVSADQILHLYLAERPNQVRGVPWGRAGYMAMRHVADYQDAQRERMRLASCFMGFRRVDSLTDVPAELQPDEYSLLDKLEPGTLEYLPPGMEMEFATPPQPEDDVAFIAGQLRAIAAGYGLPYEILTGDLSQVNFSSARMGWNEFGRNIESWRWGLLGPQLLQPIARWFLEAEALGTGRLQAAEIPLWTAPARVMVDEVREVPALVEKVRAGLISMPEAIRQQGMDPDTTLAEIAAWNAKLDAAGVVLSTDPRQDLAASATAAAADGDDDATDRPDGLDDQDDPSDAPDGLDDDPDDATDPDDSVTPARSAIARPAAPRAGRRPDPVRLP